MVDPFSPEERNFLQEFAEKIPGGITHDLYFQLMEERKKMSFEDLKVELLAKKWKNSEELYFALSVWNSSRKNQEIFIDGMREPELVGTGVIKCKFCSSVNTVYISKQLRSSDEGENLLVSCMDCKRDFKM